jgi:ATP-dependent Clp protease ATP-binding subunit ClpB
MLARGELHCIGATTLNEYREYIEKDAALERRFQPVMVDEPTVEDTITILRGLKDSLQTYHHVDITDNALVSAATLSNRYISDRFLPDKAIDLVDEACAQIKTEINSQPVELDELSQKVARKKIEEASMLKEKDELSKERLSGIQKELSELEAELNAKKAQYQNEKDRNEKLNKIREEITKLQNEAADANRVNDYGKVAEIENGLIPQKEKELQEAQEKLKSENFSMVHTEVTEEDIANIVSRWTGIPVSKLTEGERTKTLHLPDELHKQVIGQEEAVEKVSEAIMRSKAGVKDPTKPIGSFLFLGPTGVGKTELAKSLARALFDDEKNMVRIDMSEYMEKYSVSRLIGAAPGYVGYEEGGQLTEAVRRKPYSVVLFDEIEKAHPDVFNILLQVLDDGRITDSQGRTVDFKNTIIILTSNLGADIILDDLEKQQAAGKSTDRISEEAQKEVEALLHRQFRPEFLNRLDEIIMFRPLTRENISGIVDLIVADLNRRLSDRQLTIRLTDAAKAFVAEEAYDPSNGARPLKRYIQKNVETESAKLILGDQVHEGSTIVFDARDGKLTASVEN